MKSILSIFLIALCASYASAQQDPDLELDLITSLAIEVSSMVSPNGKNSKMINY
jgi:hypothetical protein